MNQVGRRAVMAAVGTAVLAVLALPLPSATGTDLGAPPDPLQRHRDTPGPDTVSTLQEVAPSVGAQMADPAVGDGAPSTDRATVVPAARPPTWALAKMTSPRPRMMESPYAVFGRRTSAGPLVVGIALSIQGGPNPFSWVDVTRLGGGATTVAFTAGPVGHQLRVEVVEDDTGAFVMRPVSIGDKAKVVAVLAFVAGGVIDEVEWATGGGDIRSTVRYGTGTRALMVGSPTGGAAITAAGYGAGTTTHERTVSRGIVGAMEWRSCQACAGTWTPPNGDERTWAHVRNHAAPACWCASGLGMETTFAGPRGSWRWTWSGASAADHLGVLTGEGPTYYTGSPVAAAYAPIGGDWKLFSQCRWSQGCIVPDPT